MLDTAVILRRLQDLPWQGRQGLSVQILYDVGHFEGIPSYLRQTSRLTETVRVVGYAAGGMPGARLLARLSIRISDDTVLRRVKAAVAPDANGSLEALGVDDRAWCKQGLAQEQSYGTILVVHDPPPRGHDHPQRRSSLPPFTLVCTALGSRITGSRLPSAAPNSRKNHFYVATTLHKC